MDSQLKLFVSAQTSGLSTASFLFMLGFMIHRGRVNNIIFEFSLAEKPFCNVILCEGLPSVPKQKELIIFLNSKGCNVFFPRYGGTWESGGEFLAKSPTEDIFTLVQHLKNGEVTELYGNKTFNTNYPINLIGTSFGGAVALSLLPRDDIHKVVAFSPIVDFKSHNSKGNEQDLHQLKTFMQIAFGFAYRFSDQNWSEMLRGDLFNPPQEIRVGREKDVLIIYDTTDKDIDANKISKYVAKKNISTITTNLIGHLSFSKIPHELWQEVINFLRV